MAAPTYTSDLADFKDFETTVTFGEFAGFTAGRGQVIDTDYPIQGNSMMSVVMNTTGNAGVAVVYGSNISWTSGWCMFSWLIWLAPAAINTQANGGLVFCLGSDISNFREWNVGGNNFGSYPYGGWQNFAVDPEIAYSNITGNPGTAYRWAGPGVRVISAVSKGSPLAIDVTRFGRGEFRVVAGETGNFATFAGMAAWNDNNSRRWGLFQAIEGGYKYKGLMTLGYGGLTNFTDLNKSIVIDNTQYVQPSFNRIEIRNASSVVDWTNISITALGTVSKGQFEIFDNATVDMDGCSFTDMDTFIFNTNATIVDTTFRRCGQITAAGGTFTGSQIAASTVAADAAAFVWDVATDTNGKLDGMSFTKGTNAHHAIQLGTSSPTSVTFDGMEFTGFNASNAQNDSAILVSRTTDIVTINITNSAQLPSYKSAGATVVVQSSYTLGIHVQDAATDLIQDAVVAVYDASDNSEISNQLTDSSGDIIPASVSGNTDIYIRIRKSTSGTRYFPIETVASIVDENLSITITMIEDTTAES